MVRTQTCDPVNDLTVVGLSQSGAMVGPNASNAPASLGAKQEKSTSYECFQAHDDIVTVAIFGPPAACRTLPPPALATSAKVCESSTRYYQGGGGRYWISCSEGSLPLSLDICGGTQLRNISRVIRHANKRQPLLAQGGCTADSPGRASKLRSRFGKDDHLDLANEGAVASRARASGQVCLSSLFIIFYFYETISLQGCVISLQSLGGIGYRHRLYSLLQDHISALALCMCHHTVCLQTQTSQGCEQVCDIQMHMIKLQGLVLQQQRSFIDTPEIWKITSNPSLCIIFIY